MDTVFQRERVNSQLEEERSAYVGLEGNNTENRKANDCTVQWRGSGLQRPDKETTRITQDRQRGTDTETSTNIDITGEREARTGSA